MTDLSLSDRSSLGPLLPRPLVGVTILSPSLTEASGTVHLGSFCLKQM